MKAVPLKAQDLLPLQFSHQPVLEQGISIEPYAVYYESPMGDTSQPVSEVVQQRFLPLSFSPHATFHNNRQLEGTSQVVWLQFGISNSYTTDTVRLWYGGGPHAFLSLYRKDSGSFYRLADVY